MEARLLGRLSLVFEGGPNESRLMLAAFAASPTDETEVDACDARFLTETEPGR